jgi:hypothetical protein
MNFKSLTLLLLCIYFSATTVNAQSVSSKISIGIEQDILPYVLNGFIGTAWAGKNKFRVRLSYAEADIPPFVLQSGFQKDRTHAVGISAEYFLKDDFKGLWFGPGIGYWNNEATTTNNFKGEVQSWVFSLGGGYNIFLWKGLYTTPWLALHTRIAGNNSRYIDNIKYTPMLFTPEVSVKLGWKF